MKKIDLISRRILSVSIGITMIILSLSLFLVSLKNVTSARANNFDDRWTDIGKYNRAHNILQEDTIINNENIDSDIEAVQVFGLGIREGNLYFGILYNNNSIGLHKAPADGEDVLDW